MARIFGSGDVIKSGFELVDAMHTSEEEGIAAKAKAKTDLLTSYAPFKIAQRYLALIFAATFVFSFLMVLLLTLFGYVQSVDDVKRVIGEFYIGEIMLVIVGFYFGGGFAEGTVNAIRSKK